jgi:hypothetical protein
VKRAAQKDLYFLPQITQIHTDKGMIKKDGFTFLRILIHREFSGKISLPDTCPARPEKKDLSHR